MLAIIERCQNTLQLSALGEEGNVVGIILLRNTVLAVMCMFTLTLTEGPLTYPFMAVVFYDGSGLFQ